VILDIFEPLIRPGRLAKTAGTLDSSFGNVITSALLMGTPSVLRQSGEGAGTATSTFVQAGSGLYLNRSAGCRQGPHHLRALSTVQLVHLPPDLRCGWRRTRQYHLPRRAGCAPSSWLPSPPAPGPW